MSSKRSFRELEQQLGEVLERVETGEYEELDELLKDYDTGTKLIAELEKKLKTAKNSIKKVKKGA